MAAAPIRPDSADLVVAGAGIVGLSIAWEGVRRGMSVVVVEQDARPVGASIRNFGHACLTAQVGVAREYAEAARTRWLELRDEAGLWVREAGAVVVARSDEEAAVLAEFADATPHVHLLDADQVRRYAPVSDQDLVGGAFLADDVRLDPRTAAPQLAAYLQQLGVQFLFGTAALGADTGVLRTSRGDIDARHVVLALGHDITRLLPEQADAAGLRRCQLHMLRVAVPNGWVLEPALLTGTSLLRYDGFLACPSVARLRSHFETNAPGLLAAGVNLMFTQAPNGDLLVGDTHTYEETPSPFAAEELDQLLLSETRQLFAFERMEVRERWLGVYPWTPDFPFLTPMAAPGVVGVAVTSGIGMTTALGLAPAVLNQLVASVG